MPRRFWKLFPYLILCLGAASAALAWWQARARYEAETRAELNRMVDRFSRAVVDRMETYTDAHYNAVGFLEASDLVTSDEWTRFVSTTDLYQRYPGIRSFCYATYVKLADKEAFIAKERQQRPGFEVFPAGSRADYAVVSLVAPLDAQRTPAIGYDMASDAVRRAALERSMKEGKPALTPVLSLYRYQDTRAFLLYVPWFRDGPVRQMEGWVYSSFIAEDFFTSLLDAELESQLHDVTFRVYDGRQARAEDLLFDNTTAGEPVHTLRSTIAMYGRSWLVEYHFTSGAIIGNDESWMILLGGISIMFLAYRLAQVGVSIQRRAVDLAESMTIKYEARSLELEKRNEELDAFVYVASHDLKSPLGAMASLAYLVKAESEETLSEDSMAHLSMIEERSQFMSELLDGLLEFATVGKGNQTLRSVDTGAMLESVAQALAISEKATLAIETPMPTVQTSDAVLRQVFLNLLTNAIKYASERPPEISVKCREREQDWLFSIQDNGIGIATEHLERVFVMFTRLQKKPDVEGTGLGLALLKKQLAHLGGEIWVESRQDMGSTFFFTLPKGRSTPT